MLTLAPHPPEALDTVVCVGAHADDIEIGCGATIAQLAAERPSLRIVWVVLSAEGVRADEARAAAARLTAGRAQVTVADFPDRHFPTALADLKRSFDELARRCAPQLVFTPRRDDRHQDHRVVAELTWQAFRDQLICEYEIPKYEGDLAPPNAYAAVSGDAMDAKVATLLEEFGSQRDRDWFDAELFRGLARVRGVECRAPSGYAEAFHVAKLRLW